MLAVVGVPKEVKDQERRVSMQPDGVTELVHHGHEVIVQEGAEVRRLLREGLPWEHLVPRSTAEIVHRILAQDPSRLLLR